MRISTCAVHPMYTIARLAKCGPLDLAGDYVALERWELGATGTRGES